MSSDRKKVDRKICWIFFNQIQVMENKSLGWFLSTIQWKIAWKINFAFEKLSFVHSSTHGTIKQQKPFSSSYRIAAVPILLPKVLSPT